MNPVLRVLSPGLLTTIQDNGRPGYQHLGIPVGGALDPVSLAAANLLVGNAAGTGALEVAYIGPTFVIDATDAHLSFAGAEARIEIFQDEAAREGTLIDSMRSIRLNRGQVVKVGSLRRGALLYIAVEGGFRVEPVFGSQSTSIRGGFGGWQGRALSSDDELPLMQDMASDRVECRLDGLDLGHPRRFRVIAGPQSDYFSERAMAEFFQGEYTIRAGSNRMAMRLDGPPIEHSRGFNITSDAIAAGSIQIPGDGQPIVLLADRQTTGGYPKIATVISADVPALGRLPIGSKITFEPVSMEEATAARRKFMAEISGIDDMIMPILSQDFDITPRLLGMNLISGAHDAHNFTI